MDDRHCVEQMEAGHQIKVRNGIPPRSTAVGKFEEAGGC